MNLIALIGMIESIKKVGNSNTVFSLKVERQINDEEYGYDDIDVTIDNNAFKSELEQINKNSIIGIKGYLATNNNECHVVAERLQLF